MLCATQRGSRWVTITQGAGSFLQSPKSPGRSLADVARCDSGREIPRSMGELSSRTQIQHHWGY